MPSDVSITAAGLVAAAADALSRRKDEVDRLNVFPVPDGDTGTNMALTMSALVREVSVMRSDASLAEVCHAATTASLMGARGNSGVILSQIVRGLCEVVSHADSLTSDLVAEALRRAVTVAFQAVRKPVEGTMLTVLRDTADAATASAENGDEVEAVLEAAMAEAFESVRRTPELLPVLKEAGVVDAGGYGLALLFEGLAAGIEGRDTHAPQLGGVAHPVAGEPVNDWDDEDHLYCTEFLLHGADLDRPAIEAEMAAAGGSQLVVGDGALLKVHVHTDDPASVLAYATSLGQVSEVHVNNMRLQTAARSEALSAEATPAELKPVGFVAVAAGDGLQAILRSLGIDEVVSGGQTMNPSTADLLAAVERVPADSVVILPDNRNIIMAAQQVVGIAPKRVAVVPTTSVPEAFSAILAFDPEDDLDTNVESMGEAAAGVKTGEITRAVKDSKGAVGKIKAGQFIGISDHEILAVGDDLPGVAASLLGAIADGGESLTLLAGADMSDVELGSLAEMLGGQHPELELETHRGDQPLYPLIMSVE
jgi:DAK2 domain fusion protein YloV